MERNPLAADYLQSVLGLDQNFEILSEESTLRAPRAWDIPTPVFAIDMGTLPGPLVLYLTVLRSRFPKARVLLLGGEPSPDELRRLPFLGVQGFVSYDDVKNRLVPAIQAISRGDLWFAQTLRDEFPVDSHSPRSKSQSRAPSRRMFTPREELVVGLLTRRLGNKEIASVLGVRERTVRFHLANIFRKLGVHDRHSAAEVVRPLGRPIILSQNQTVTPSDAKV